jgi:hypothetical protein
MFYEPRRDRNKKRTCEKEQIMIIVLSTGFGGSGLQPLNKDAHDGAGESEAGGRLFDGQDKGA